MSRKKKENYVSDLLDIEKDIVPYPVTAIWSGVGSGKNGFIEGVHIKKENNNGTITKTDVVGLAEKFRVLIVTSRKSKVNQTEKSHAKDLSPYLTDVRHIDDVNFDKYKAKSLICTTSHIKTRIQNDWNPSASFKYFFWYSFDYIIIDEFHSLVDDATFSDSAFIMKCFIDKIYNDCIKNKTVENIKPKLIFMSATPDSSKELLKDFNYQKHNLLDKTLYVKPKNIEFTYNKAAIEEIKHLLKSGKTVVYYACQLNDKINRLIEIAKGVGVSENEIAVSVSSDKINDMLKKEYQKTIYRNKEEFESELSNKQLIPEKIKFIITNCKNKEGININNNPDLLVIEQHYESDIIQICGRFRNGVKNVKIIYDAIPFPIPTKYKREEEFQKECGLKAANDFFDKLVEEKKFPINHLNPYNDSDFVEYINFIENSTPYLRYNPFNCRFEINNCYIEAKERYLNSIYDFNKMIQHAKYGNIILGGYYTGINVTFKFEDDLELWLEGYFKLNNYIFNETIFTEKQGQKLLKDLNKIYTKQPGTSNKEFKSIGAILKYFGCKRVSEGKHDNKKFKIAKLGNK